jgi:glycosyltransferase involved in cell wall biosynthesis
MDLSVVIASIESARSIDECLRHLERSCAGLQAEFIVADASRDGTAARVAPLDGPVVLLRCTPNTLAPELWAAGYRKSTGRIVAFTTGHCLVSAGWAAALTEALDRGATGAGGPLVIGEGTGLLDWAVFYLRYAGVMPHMLGGGGMVQEIAGDNAAYRREALDRHRATFARGFWEVDFHRLVRADGGWLAAAPQAVIAFSRSFPARTILRHRFAHGRQFCAVRVGGGTRRAWEIVLAAPLVPFVLAGRAAIRAARGPAPWRFIAALPWFLPLAGAWAAGEAWGALAGPPAPRHSSAC